MKLKDINDSNKDSYLKITDLENMFLISYDKFNNLNYNLNETLVLNIDDSYIEYYTPNYDMFWPLISYNKYGTTRLAWLLMKLNNVSANDVFSSIKAGTSIKCVNDDFAKQIILVIL